MQHPGWLAALCTGLSAVWISLPPHTYTHTFKRIFYCCGTLYLQIIKSTPNAFQGEPDIRILWPWLTVVTWIIFKSTLWSLSSIKTTMISLFLSAASSPLSHFQTQCSKGRTKLVVLLHFLLFFIILESFSITELNVTLCMQTARKCHRHQNEEAAHKGKNIKNSSAVLSCNCKYI